MVSAPNIVGGNLASQFRQPPAEVFQPQILVMEQSDFLSEWTLDEAFGPGSVPPCLEIDLAHMVWAEELRLVQSRPAGAGANNAAERFGAVWKRLGDHFMSFGHDQRDSLATAGMQIP